MIRISPLSSLSKPSSSSMAALVSPAGGSAAPAPTSSIPENSVTRATSSSLHESAQPPSPSHPSWSSLFNYDQVASLQYHQPLVADGKPSVFICKLIHKLRFSACVDFLVGQFLGITPPFSQIQAIAR